jgi:transketolase
MTTPARDLRIRILEILARAGRGHLGPALSVLDILDVVYGQVLKFDPSNPDWPERDRFILSKGHGCLALYVVLEKYGFIKPGELESFCSFDSIFGGHPESGRIPGIEFSTGSLGHGLSVGVGIAVAARILKKDWSTFVLMGDGELNEGSVWEALAHAAKHKLDNLCVIVDYNRMQASGLTVDCLNMDSISEKFCAFGFRVVEVDGHNPDLLKDAFNLNKADDFRPLAVIAHTLKGKGVTLAENSTYWHHRAKITTEEIDKIKESLKP